jgi:hypothetical protein
MKKKNVLPPSSIKKTGKGVIVLLPRLIETYYRPTLVLPKAVINMPPQHVPERF